VCLCGTLITKNVPLVDDRDVHPGIFVALLTAVEEDHLPARPLEVLRFNGIAFAIILILNPLRAGCAMTIKGKLN